MSSFLSSGPVTSVEVMPSCELKITKTFVYDPAGEKLIPRIPFLKFNCWPGNRDVTLYPNLMPDQRVSSGCDGCPYFKPGNERRG